MSRYSVERTGHGYKEEDFRTPHQSLADPSCAAEAQPKAHCRQDEEHGAGAGLAGSAGHSSSGQRGRKHREALRERLRPSRCLHLWRLPVEKGFD